MMLSCTYACAQDTNRVLGANQDVSAVDVSVQAGVGELAKQAPPSQEPGKIQTTYSRWAFQPSQSAATRFGPIQETKPAIAANAVYRPQDGSTGRLAIPALDPQPQTNGLSTPFRKKQLGLASVSAFPNPFSQTAFSSRGDSAE